MARSSQPKPLVAIACGGTGGHFFPGIAVADQLRLRGCDVTLLISPKEVDQEAVKNALGMNVATLPAVGMTRGRFGQFLLGFWKSYQASKQLFRTRRPEAVLAMGGFTSAPPVLAGRSFGAATFLHESNTIPGKANRWLAHFVSQAFVGFPTAAGRLHHTNILCTGTPVRPQFEVTEPGSCRMALGLDPKRPTLLIMGGSQGASGINDLVLQSLPQLLKAAPELQFLHLTGPNDVSKVEAGYALHQARVVVKPFLTEMELALGAATVAVSRAGASSLAELAAMQLPAVLIPYPTAADNHQLHNAGALVESGAALMLPQKGANPLEVATHVLSIVQDKARRAAMATALAGWHRAEAAELIADRMIALMEAMRRGRGKQEPARDAVKRTLVSPSRAQKNESPRRENLSASSSPDPRLPA